MSKLDELIGRFVTRYPDDVGADLQPSIDSAHLIETTRDHYGVPSVVTRCGREMAAQNDEGTLAVALDGVDHCQVCDPPKAVGIG